MRVVAISLLLFCCPLVPRSQEIGPLPEVALPSFRLSLFDEEHERGIFFAVLEGLYEDGVNNEVVDAILAVDPDTGYPANFVWACPICMPALNAANSYRARISFVGKKLHRDTFGAGLEESRRAAILGDDGDRRRAAIQELVEGWIMRRLDRARLTESERADWTRAMEEGRKLGMEYLEAYRSLGGSYAEMKGCPFCDAGVEAAAER
jgi:hypothetical protein